LVDHTFITIVNNLFVIKKYTVGHKTKRKQSVYTVDGQITGIIELEKMINIYSDIEN